MGKSAVYVFEVNIYDDTKAPHLICKCGAFLYLLYFLLFSAM